MALQAQAVIVGWQIYSLTGDLLMLGLVGLVEAVPAIACALFAGHVVDISRPHFVFRMCIGTIALNTLFLLLFAGGIIPIPFGKLIHWIFAGIFISGLARSFIMPSSFSLLPQIIPREKIAAASAWMTSGFQVAAITGPAVAGLIYGGYGVQIAWLLPVILMSIAFVMISAISNHHRQFRRSEKSAPAVQSIKEGWKFILTNNVLLSIMALDMFAVLFGGATAMLPAIADKVLHVGSEGLGMLRAAPAIGSICTALFLAVRPLKTIKATVLLYAIAGFGFSMIGFGMSTVFAVSIFFLVLSGAFDSVSMVVRSTLMQLLVPDNMRGRVSAVNSMFIISSNEIGAFESGVAAKLFGLVPSIIFGGIGTLVVVSVTSCSKKLRKTVVSTDRDG